MKVIVQRYYLSFEEEIFLMEFKDIYAKDIHAQLIQQMRSGVYANCTQLPRESELSKALGISRTQLRDILAVLECEGFITRRHGVGTLINRHVLKLPVRIDMEQEFMDMIYAGGYTPSVLFAKAADSPATAEEAAQLGIEPGAMLIRSQKLCAANKRPAIYCEDMFAASLLRQPVTDQNFRPPIFQLLQENCRLNCYMDVSRLIPTVAQGEIAEILQLEPGTPLMYIEEVDYDVDGNPILFSRQYFVNDYFRHNIIRKRL